MFHRRIILGAKKVIPHFIYKKLDPFEAKVEEKILELARDLEPGIRVLDAGAGEGRFKSIFLHTRYVGIDLAIGNPQWDYSGVDLIGNIQELPFANNSFQVIINIAVLEHLKEPKKALLEFQRVMKPRGILFLVAPFLWERHQKPYDYFRFTSHGLEYLAKGAGFKEIEIEPIGGYFWLLGRRLLYILSFFQKGWKIIFFLFFGLILFFLLLIFFYLDAIDRERDYTLGYICYFRK